MKFKFLSVPILLITLLFSSCRDEDISPLFICGVYDPVLELTWLADKTAEINQSDLSPFIYIAAAKYQGNDVIIEKNCCPNCNSVALVYSCDGQTIGFLGTGSIDPNSITDETVIWRGANFTCGV